MAETVYDRVLGALPALQIGLFAFVMIGLWLMEKRLLSQPLRAKWRHGRANAAFVLSDLPIQLMMLPPCMAVTAYAAEHHFGLVYVLGAHEHPLVKYGLMFFLLDLFSYLYHFTMHNVGAFWRFHLVHHTDRILDVSTTVREHPGETLIRNLFLVGSALLCGASMQSLVLRQTFQTVSNILSHSAVRLPPWPARVLGWLLVTPNLHHVHHHFRLPATNCNYGDVLSIWDRLFGTYLALSAEETVFGLDTHMDRRISDA